MSSPRFEAFLARLYSDAEFLSRFMRSPEEVSREAGLSPREQAAAAAIDRAGLLMAARSYELKRGPGSRRGSLADSRLGISSLAARSRSVACRLLRWLRWGFR